MSINLSGNPLSKKSQTHYLRNAIYLLIILIIGTIIYWDSFSGPFVYDDINYIGRNDPHVHMTRFTLDQLKEAAFEGKPRSRPLSNISFALNYYFNGTRVFGYHLVNLIIHLLTGLFIYIFIRITLRIDASSAELGVFRSSGRQPSLSTFSLIAFISAMIWLVHPVQSQAVTYIVQRMTSMAAMFYILAMVFYIKGRDLQTSDAPRPGIAAVYFIFCMLSATGAIASKQNAGMLPVFIIIYEFFFFQNLKIPRLKPLLFLMALFFIFAVIALIYLGKNPIDRILASYNIRDFDMAQRLLTEPRVVIYYICLILFPHPLRLNLDHDYPISQAINVPVTTLPAISAIIGLIGIAAYLVKKKERLLAFCIIWFLGNLVIESTVHGIEIIYEHRTYLPSIMICLMVVVITLRVVKKNWIIAGFLSCVILLLSVSTIQRNTVWQNEIIFWQDCIKKSPNKQRPYLNLGYAFHKKENYKDALFNYNKAISMNPDLHISSAYYNMGKAFIGLKKYYEAIESYSKALMGKPKNRAQIHIALALALESIDELESATIHYRQALKIDPSNNHVRKKLQSLKTFMDKNPDPLIRGTKRLKIDPKNPALHFRLGKIYEQQEKFKDAEQTYETALLLMNDPKQKLYIITLNQLARLNALTRDYDSAIDLFEKSNRLDPDNPMIQYNLAVLYSVKRQISSSGYWLERALKNGYDDWAYIQKDPNMKNFRNTKEYLHLKREYDQNKYD